MNETQAQHLAMLRRQNQELLERNEKLQKEVSRIPLIILQARLDAKEGKPTKYSR